MKAFVVYTALRVAVFVAAAALLAVLGARGLLLIGGALLVSGLASLPLLSRQRDAVSVALVRRGERNRSRLDAGAAAEDEDR